MNNQLIDQLEKLLGTDNVLTKPELMTQYVIDWRRRYSGQALAVVFPTSNEQIQRIVNLCRMTGTAIIPQGGNTSTCGGATPLNNYVRSQIIVNMARMNQVLNLDKKNYSLHVQAGATLTQIQEYVQKYDLYFPLAIASQGSCQIGGNLATNAGGIHVLKYGMTRELTLGLKAITADGKEIDQLFSLHKNNSYLDLKQLFIGSEGTLGIISEVILKLFPLPANWHTLLCGVKSLDQALALLYELRRISNNNVCAFEIIYKDSQRLYKQHFPNSPLPLEDEWLILAELETTRAYNPEDLIYALNANHIDLSQVIITDNSRERNELWQIREHLPLAEKQHGYAAKHDIALPLSQLDSFLQLNMPKLLALVPNGYFSIFGHLGDGNLHYNFGIPGANASAVAKLEELVSPLVYNDVIQLGGTISAEHGIGQSKKYWLKEFCSDNNYQLLLDIKKVLDPDNIFNPGKVF